MLKKKYGTKKTSPFTNSIKKQLYEIKRSHLICIFQNRVNNSSTISMHATMIAICYSANGNDWQT